MSKTALTSQPFQDLPVFWHRSTLRRTRNALADGRLAVGFIGGSITAGWDHTWPGPLLGWMADQYPGVELRAENAAIPATGTDSACLRVDREIIDRGCDLTFVEYAVNDHDKEPGRRGRTQEGLLRKLLAAGGDVVLIYTFCQEMYADMVAGNVPASIAALERLANHYALNAVWVGLHALRDVASGRMKWEQWLPDGLHPEARGSWSYATAVQSFLATSLTNTDGQGDPAGSLPPSIFEGHWQSAWTLPLEKIDTQGAWVLKRFYGQHHLDQVLETHAPGSALGFYFVGRGLAFIFNYGRRSAEFRYRLDGGDWITAARERPDWGGDRGLVRAFVVDDTLDYGTHRFELEVLHGDRADCTGTEFRLGVVGVLG